MWVTVILCFHWHCGLCYYHNTDFCKYMSIYVIFSSEYFTFVFLWYFVSVWLWSFFGGIKNYLSWDWFPIQTYVYYYGFKSVQLSYRVIFNHHTLCDWFPIRKAHIYLSYYIISVLCLIQPTHIVWFVELTQTNCISEYVYIYIYIYIYK